MVLRPRLWLGVLIVLLGGYRMTLIHSGHFYWSDERCYLPAARLIDALGAGEFREAAGHLFAAGPGVPPARPAFVVVSTIPGLLQRAVGAVTGIDAASPRYYDAAAAFNVLVTLGVTVILFALGRAWTGSPWYGLLIAAVYSLLCNANVWIRHLLPYPEALLFGLSGLWLLSTRPEAGLAPRRAALAGVLTAAAYACYPGHYAFVIINGAVAAVAARPRVRSTLWFGAGALVVIGGFEALSRWAGRSYLDDLRRLSSGIHMGDPKEGYAFLWHYLRDVEGVAGVTLMALFLCFVVVVLFRRKTGLPGAARVAFVAAVACYLFHASMGVVFSKTVFYGRVLMVYLPFVVGGAVVGLMHIGRASWRRVAVGGLVIASLWSFISFARVYGRLVYPADFLQEAMANRGRTIRYPANVLWGLANGHPDGTVENLDPELVTVVDPRPDGSEVFVRLAAHRLAGKQHAAGAPPVRESSARFIAVNVKYMGYVRQRYDRFVPPEGYVLVAEALHPEVFPATGYEGRRPWERRRLRKRQYTMRLYERVEDVKTVTAAASP